MHYIQQFFRSILFLSITSCSSNYPTELVEADSMLMKSRYHEADSLLNVYHTTNTIDSQESYAYYQLLSLIRLFVTSELSFDNYIVADSLERFYNDKSTREYVIARLLLSEIYRANGDYPSAMSKILLAEQSTALDKDATLQIWVNRMIGDVFYEQRLFSECICYYRKSFEKAKEQHDTLRMSHGAFSMSQVCIINNQVDSAIYFLKKSMDWSKCNNVGVLTYKPAQSLLADIYIQTEQFDKAEPFLTRDSIDDVNWAYWHLGQNHVDSAIYYFKKMIGVYGWGSDCDFLGVLEQLEEQRGNHIQALNYSKRRNEAQDSFAVHSQAEEIQQAKAKHEIEKVKRERDAAERHGRNLSYMLLTFVLFTIIISVAVIIAWRAFRSKKENELLRRKLLLKEERQINKMSKEQIIANEKQIAQLRDNLQRARLLNDVVAMEHLQSEERVLETENDSIRARSNYAHLMQKQLEQSALRERIKLNAGKETFHLKDEEWLELASLIDNAYNMFTSRIRSLYDNISIDELHICYLIKIDVGPSDIGVMLYKSKAAIGMARQRLYYKMTGCKGTARDLDNLIRRM